MTEEGPAYKPPVEARDSKFNRAVDGTNRLVRPLVTYWLVGGLMALWPLPRLEELDPMTANLVWTVVSFWFGSRMLFKDLPAAYRMLQK
jgi:hypothetical protein